MLLSIGYLDILNNLNKATIIIRRGLSTMQKELAEKRATAKSEDETLCILDWFLAIDACLT